MSLFALLLRRAAAAPVPERGGSPPRPATPVAGHPPGRGAPLPARTGKGKG